MLGALLESASAIKESSGSVAIVFGRGAAAARQLERKENLDLIRKQAEQLLGRPASVKIETATAPAPGGDLPKSAGGRRPTKAARSTEGELLKRARKEAGVNKLLHEFGAQVVKIRPLSSPQDRRLGDESNGNSEEPS
jgi:hypothetical protein